MIFEQQSFINIKRNKNYSKNDEIQAGSGAGFLKTGSDVKLSGSATLLVREAD